MSVEDPRGLLGSGDTRKLQERFAAMAALVGAGQAACDVVLTSDARMRELNRQFRGMDAPTDVLAFSLEPTFEHEAVGLGEIYISVDRARAQALEHGRPFAEEVAHLALHGFLHLVGHDHLDAAGLEAMEALVARVLGLAPSLSEAKE